MESLQLKVHIYGTLIRGVSYKEYVENGQCLDPGLCAASVQTVSGLFQEWFDSVWSVVISVCLYGLCLKCLDNL